MTSFTALAFSLFTYSILLENLVMACSGIFFEKPMAGKARSRRLLKEQQEPKYAGLSDISCTLLLLVVKLYSSWDIRSAHTQRLAGQGEADQPLLDDDDQMERYRSAALSRREQVIPHQPPSTHYRLTYDVWVTFATIDGPT